MHKNKINSHKKNFTINYLISVYNKECKSSFDEFLSLYKNINNINQLIEYSVKGNINKKKHPHQRRIPNKVQNKFIKKLLCKRRALHKAKTFTDIFCIINKEKIKGIGDLSI